MLVVFPVTLQRTSRVAQVVANFTSNAIKFSQAGAAVTIAAKVVDRVSSEFPVHITDRGNSSTESAETKKFLLCNAPAQKQHTPTAASRTGAHVSKLRQRFFTHDPDVVTSAPAPAPVSVVVEETGPVVESTAPTMPLTDSQRSRAANRFNVQVRM